ncbi:glycosyltransferase [Lapidilactobacillus concavus DSM 17758]|uniref:Glycosyltransferase n=1 Tax=Lapidilactobacillus concavus DSM 17758 TaxID=1423735 RepID=A0A0R1W532_9LACO|nr:glycosyltransferase family 4 protein [Lapidilactobacillus concavus]KRM12896.1 glycosyltransferase [Lapidilactobacillus concavus DSM 17758]GEL13215.1 glycosyl transferase [Lapidilactobacillus concavus]
MNIGIFTDTYFPQVSGVATSIRTLKDDLERKGHHVYIFTTTDPGVDKEEVEPNIFRFGSVPFISFTDRRVAVRGLFHALEVAKELDLDLVHTQTEFSMGWIGKFVAKNLKIPCVHTYHTMYEDYLHYVLNGHLLKPYHVKQFVRTFVSHMDGVVAPSQRVTETLRRYGVKIPIRVIPTGIDLKMYDRPEPERVVQLRSELGYTLETPVMMTLSRLASEKRIDQVLSVFPALVKAVPGLQFMIVGDGPEREELEALAQSLGVKDAVKFVGEVKHDQISPYYQLANLFVSSSDTETQGLTYIEAIAAGLKCTVRSGEYTDHIFDDPDIGTTFRDLNEMQAQVINYLQHPHAFSDPKPRERKLIEISADHFGDSVLDFYQDATDNYRLNNLNRLSMSDRSDERL